MILVREDIAKVATLSEEQMQADIKEYTEWVESLSNQGKYLGGDPLEPEGRYITNDNIATDGPFIESKEVITGYILISAANMEEAISITKTCPVFRQGGLVELRPVMKF